MNPGDYAGQRTNYTTTQQETPSSLSAYGGGNAPPNKYMPHITASTPNNTPTTNNTTNVFNSNQPTLPTATNKYNKNQWPVNR